jgi:hypothetical protein
LGHAATASGAGHYGSPVPRPSRPHRRAHRRLTALAAATSVVAGLAAVVVPADASPPPPPDLAGPADLAELAPTGTTAGLWTPVDDAPEGRRDGLRRRVDPSAYAGYHLDLPTLTDHLDRAPLERAGAAPLLVEVPAPTGELVEFAVAESPVMEPGLAERHPGITTYAGRSTSGTPASIRLDVTPMGFHASVRGAGAAWYVDPAYNGPDQGADALYLSYLGSDLPAPEQPLVEPELPDAEGLGRERGDIDPPRVGEGGGAVAIQRTYRLALVTDPSYASYFGTTSDSVVTAEKTTLVNRVNHVYGDDFSIRLLLVAGNDQLNFNTTAQFTGANGRCGQLPCYSPTLMTDGCYSPTADQQDYYALTQNRIVTGQLIGAENFDIGHIAFGPAGDGGGIAGLGVVGGRFKAEGCTGLNPPTGDAFAIDYVAHELGHQFGGDHTFNSLVCDDNREASTSVEPGSGSSVMAYAGICGTDNLQSHSDPYFSQRSQTQVAAVTRASTTNVGEVQNVALSGYDGGEAFTLAFGAGATSAITGGTTYTAAGIKAAVEAAEPSSATATVTGLWGQSSALTHGFQITWSGTANIATPALTVTTGAFSAVVGTTDNGGPTTNRGTEATSGNRNPLVTAPASRTIPVRTPFELSGSATDPDGDAMVYLWEQNDASTNAVALGNQTKGVGPLFRVFGSYAAVTPAGSATYQSPGENRATAVPTRTFPDLAQVAAGETNQASGACPTLSGTGTSDTAALRCFSEFLPRTARTMNFRLTARDLSGADGGTSYADVAIGVSGSTPFQVTSQASATSVSGGTAGTVTWERAGTHLAPFDTADVRITFSTDGGLTFPTVLAARTPNDGEQAVTWPNLATSAGRLRVEAVDNYFFDLNGSTAAAAITVTPTATPTLTTGGTAAGQTFTAASSDALSTTPTITASSNVVAGTAITATSSTLPAGLSVVRTGSAGGDTTFAIAGGADVDPGTYPVTVTVSDGPGNADDRTVAFTVEVTRDTATLTYTGNTTSAGGAVTASTTVVDTDTTPGTVSGSVAFVDATTGDPLCTAPVRSGAASCTFAAPATRTYRVVGTLISPRYTGASAETRVVVTVPALTISGTADGGTFTAASSDPLGSPATVVAESNTVTGSAITMTAAGLPTGLTLERTATTASGTTYAVEGTADADPGSHAVTATVSDGPGNAADATVTFTVTVVKDAATLTWSGASSSTGGDVTASVSVADTDATPGVVAGTVAFVDRATGDALCSTEVVSGAAACTYAAPATRTYRVVGTLTGPRYTGASAEAQVVVTVPDPTLTTAGNAVGGSFTARSTDPVDQTVTLSATSNKVAGSAIAATATGLPAGLTLERTASEGGSTSFALQGRVAADPATYAVTVVVSDGPGNAADVTVGFRVAVSQDDATLTYTGATTGTGGPTTVSASVVDADGPGAVVGDVVFTDEVTDAELCRAAVTGGAVSCTFVAPASRTYQVTASLVSTRHQGATATATPLVVTRPPTDSTPPETRITSGPAQDSVQLARLLTFRFASEPGATYTCSLGTASAPCDAGVVTLRDLRPGSHSFRVVARDTAGNVDPTAAVRTFHVPLDDRALRAAGPWKRRAAAASYRGTYSTVSRRGATLSRTISGATSLALVVGAGAGRGAVDVFVGSRRVGRVSTAGAARTRVVALRAFGRPTSGTVRVVTTSARPVRIDGLAVLAAPVGGHGSVVRGAPLV